MLLGHNTCRIWHFFFTKGLNNFCFLKWGADPYWYRSGSRIWILIGFGSRKKENGYWSRQKRVQYQENLINLIQILILTFSKIKIKNIFSVFCWIHIRIPDPAKLLIHIPIQWNDTDSTGSATLPTAQKRHCWLV